MPNEVTGGNTSSSGGGRLVYAGPNWGYIPAERAEEVGRIKANRKAARRAKNRPSNPANVSRAQRAKTVDIGFENAPPIPGTRPDSIQPTSTQTPQQASVNTPPAWWIPTAYQTPDASQQFANAANALLPTLSPEDQRNIANYLATNHKDVYGSYANASFAPIPTNTEGLREQYLNPSRAQAALGLLDRVQKAAGGTPGAGYDFLRNALNLMSKYSSGGPMTREQYAAFANAVGDMSASAGNALSSYSNLAQLFNLPSFTAGQLVSNVPLKRLFT